MSFGSNMLSATCLSVEFVRICKCAKNEFQEFIVFHSLDEFISYQMEMCLICRHLFYVHTVLHM